MLFWRWECDGKPCSENGNVFHSSSQHNQWFRAAVIHGQSKCQINVSFDWLSLSPLFLLTWKIHLPWKKCVFNQICVYSFIWSDMDIIGTGECFYRLTMRNPSRETCHVKRLLLWKWDVSVRVLNANYLGATCMEIFYIRATVVVFMNMDLQQHYSTFVSLSPSIIGGGKSLSGFIHSYKKKNAK